MSDWRSQIKTLGWPLRRILNPRFEAVALQVDLATAAAREEGQANRQMAAVISEEIEQHSAALVELADHFSARLEAVQAALERVEARLDGLEEARASSVAQKP